MDLKPLFELAKKLKGWRLLSAIFVLALLAVFSWAFSQGSFDQLLTGVHLKSDQVFWLIAIFLLLAFLIILAPIFMSAWREVRKPPLKPVQLLIHVHHPESKLNGVEGVSVRINVPGLLDAVTDAKGDARFEIVDPHYIGQSRLVNAWQGEQHSPEVEIDLKDLSEVNIPWIPTKTIERAVPPPDPISGRALREAYLNYVFEVTGLLPLSFVDKKALKESEAQLNLSAIYTALLTGSQDASPEGSALAPRLRLEGEPRPSLSALEHLNRSPRLVLLGDPGSGKSTFLNFVALCLAGEALHRPEANLALLCTPLPQTSQEKKEPEPQPWDHGVLLPLRIILRDFAARGLPGANEIASVEHLWRFVADELTGAGLAEFQPALRREFFEQGGLLLVDGLDEVSEAEQRRRQIKQVIEGFAKAFPKCRILATSRTYAYQKQDWRLAKFDEAILAPFTDPQITTFISRWYDHIALVRHQNLDNARGRSQALKQAIFAKDRLHELARRPLLLTLMASLHAWREGNLPEKREELYDEAVDLLLDWWEQGKQVRDARGQVIQSQPGLVEYLKTDRDQLRSLLNELAFQAHAGQTDLSGTADVPEEKLIAGLLHLSKNPEVNPISLMEYLSDRAGLLLPRANGVYTFPHRTFQEYLAACHLTDDEYPEKIASLACQDINRWREVALLAGAKAARGAAVTTWDLVDELCHVDESSNCQENRLWGAHLAAQVLVESAGLNRVSERNQPKLERVQKWLVHILQHSDLPAAERALAGSNLGRLGDPRLEITTLDTMEFCFIPAGPFRMGEGKEEHTVDLPAFWLERFPITNAQFDAFVVARGYSEGQYWAEAQTAGWWKDGTFKGRLDDEPRTHPVEFREPFGLPNHPVVGVNWYEALAYTRWLDALAHRQGWLTGAWQVTLPSEAQWEKAARGGLQLPKKMSAPTQLKYIQGLAPVGEEVENDARDRPYPWVGKFDPERANTAEVGINSTSAAGCFPRGASPYGHQDLSGNTWEWIRSRYASYPYQPADGREDLTNREDRVLRGGSWNSNERGAFCAYRYWRYPDLRSGYIGFRCSLSPVPG